MGFGLRCVPDVRAEEWEFENARYVGGGRGESGADVRSRTARPIARLCLISVLISIELSGTAGTDCSRTAAAVCFFGAELRSNVT
jgi:hypothetical protein